MLINCKKITIAAIACLSTTHLCAEDSHLNLALGGFDVSHSSSAMGQIEYVFAAQWAGFKPHVGLFFSSDSAAYIYGGIAYPFEINDKWSFTPGVSAGYYHQGADLDLGYDVEFYSQLKLEYQLDNETKIGVGIGHISNADLNDHNPGAETAYLSYSFML